MGQKKHIKKVRQFIKRKLIKEKPTKEKDGTLLLNYSEVLEYPDKYMKYYFFFIYVYHAIHTIFWKEFFEKKFDNLY